MAGIYDAVIRDGSKIIARVNLTDPKIIPWWWAITDAFGREIDEADLLERVIDPAKPLHIVKRKSFDDHGSAAEGVKLRVRGSGFERGNSEGNRVIGVENVYKMPNFWRTLGDGLNLKGHCENRDCTSRVGRRPRSVIVSLRMPTITLTPSTTYKCSACNKFTFKPDNFIVSKALCTFQYKLTGNRVLQSITVGLDALHTKYIKMEDPVNQQEYDYVKITAMPLNFSTHDCFMCGKWIGELKDGMTSTLKGCVHHWHKTCYTGVDCPVCSAPIISSEAAIANACSPLKPEAGSM